MTITTVCSGFAEVTIEVVPPAMCAIGVYTLNPQFCTPWAWLVRQQDFKELHKKAVELGCDIVVQAGPSYYRIILREKKKVSRRARATYRALNTPAGIQWLMKRLQGF